MAAAAAAHLAVAVIAAAATPRRTNHLLPLTTGSPSTPGFSPFIGVSLNRNSWENVCHAGSQLSKKTALFRSDAVRHLTGSVTATEGLRFAVVVARFNEIITKPLLEGALETFKKYSVKEEDVDVVWVPGSFEIGVVAEKLGKSHKYHAIVCIGAPPPPSLSLSVDGMGSSANGGGGGRGSSTSSGVDKGVDFANYFCTYGYLYHQKEMLCDRVRMDAYYDSVFKNKHHFHGKTVLDVGTGSGILAIWSAQAGARKVYAVEATKMSEHARELVKANNLQDVVEVIEGSIEDVTLPEKVDVIISEWMGYFLLRESMFDSVICARDRWLKPTGIMYPSHARMWLAPIRSGLGDQKMHDYEGSMDDWFSFVDETKTYYGVDMNVLTKPFAEEQKKYYLQTSLWSNLHPNQVIGGAALLKEIDCLTVTVSDILNVRAHVSSSISFVETRLCGFTGWFDVHFRGSKENPAHQEIELTTAPSEDHGTHWGQQVFLWHPPVFVSENDTLNIDFSMVRSKENHRLMEVDLSCDIKRSSGKQLQPFTNKFYIE